MNVGGDDFYERKGRTTFTNLENEKIDEVIEKWRDILKNENMSEIRKIQQFIIPTKKLKFFII